MTKCGYIALLGQPNAGKSTLMNALIGQKIAVVSRKPQTTRNRILGVVSSADSQLLFLDTPGIHRARGTTLLNSALNNVALETTSEADIICYLVDVESGFTQLDAKFLLNFLIRSDAPFAILISKSDTKKKIELQPSHAGISFQFREWLATQEQSIQDRLLFDGPQTISAKRPEEVADLRDSLGELMPEGPWLFEADDITDMSGDFLCSEMIREQLFRQLGQELPYGCAVRIDQVQDKETIVVLDATISVSSKHHKPIILGKHGSKIKNIGAEARKSLEKYFEKKVFLTLQVDISSGWTNDLSRLTDLAHLQAQL